MTYLTINLRKSIRCLLALLLANITLVQGAQAQLSYRSGQHIEPAYEGWLRNDDDTITLVFGYFNENWEQEPNIEVGENNFFSPGERDRGQPTRFLPRRNRFTFEVVVPAPAALSPEPMCRRCQKFWVTADARYGWVRHWWSGHR